MSLHKAFLDVAQPVYSTDAVSVAVGRPAPWVFLSRVRGHFNVEGARLIGRMACEQRAGEPRYLLIFNEWSEMSDYDSAARIAMTDYARELLPATQAMHICITSSRVAFGVKAANLVVQRIAVHMQIDTFVDALAAAVERPTLARAR